MANRYGVRAFAVLDTGAVELPDHDAAIDNLDVTNPRLLLRYGHGRGRTNCKNCGDPISDGAFCGMCREMGCSTK